MGQDTHSKPRQESKWRNGSPIAVHHVYLRCASPWSIASACHKVSTLFSILHSPLLRCGWIGLNPDPTCCTPKAGAQLPSEDWTPWWPQAPFHSSSTGASLPSYEATGSFRVALPESQAIVLFFIPLRLSLDIIMMLSVKDSNWLYNTLGLFEVWCLQSLYGKQWDHLKMLT